jgi:putative protease
MVTEDCLKTVHEPCTPKNREQPGDTWFSGIRDEKGEVWPVWQDRSCRTIIGSPAELCLIGHLATIAAAGIREIVIDARHRPPQYIAAMVPLYRDAIGKPGAGGSSPDALVKNAAKITGRITTGHFLRGLTES